MQTLQQTLEDLIRFRSSKHYPEQITACADYIADFFKDTNLKVERFEKNGIPSIVVTKGTKTPKVFLCGHFDVVSGTDEQFEPRIEDGKMYARGAVDMKGGNAGLMHVMKELADTEHSVGLMMTGDEESGGFNGVKYLLEEEGYSCDVVLIPDGGRAVHRIISKEKGILWLKFTARGVASHASLPWLGESAYTYLQNALNKVQELFIPVSEHPEDHWVNTCQVTTFNCGKSRNQVPAIAEATCDIRFTEAETAQGMLDKVKAVLPDEIDVEVIIEASPVFVPLEDTVVKSFVEVLASHGREAEYVLDHGSSDGRFFSERGIPVLISQPDGKGAHAPKEWVDLSAVELYYEVVKEYVQKIG